MKLHLALNLAFLVAVTTMAAPAIAQSASVVATEAVTTEIVVPEPSEVPAPADVNTAGAIYGTLLEGYGAPQSPAVRRVTVRTSANNSFSGAQQQLASAKTEEEKQAAKQNLKKALSDEFDADLKKRQAELEKIKKRVVEMEALLEKRVASKESIVGLRLQVLVQKADGLGWSQDSNSRSRSRSLRSSGFGGGGRSTFGRGN